MNNSYANKILIAELQDFPEPLCRDVRRPVAKHLFDLVYEIARSGSTLVSRIGQALR